MRTDMLYSVPLVAGAEHCILILGSAARLRLLETTVPTSKSPSPPQRGDCLPLEAGASNPAITLSPGELSSLSRLAGGAGRAMKRDGSRSARRGREDGALSLSLIASLPTSPPLSPPLRREGGGRDRRPLLRGAAACGVSLVVRRHKALAAGVRRWRGIVAMYLAARPPHLE